jgi:hypothetical protein
VFVGGVGVSVGDTVSVGVICTVGVVVASPGLGVLVTALGTTVVVDTGAPVVLEPVTVGPLTVNVAARGVVVETSPPHAASPSKIRISRTEAKIGLI